MYSQLLSCDSCFPKACYKKMHIKMVLSTFSKKGGGGLPITK